MKTVALFLSLVIATPALAGNYRFSTPYGYSGYSPWGNNVLVLISTARWASGSRGATRSGCTTTTLAGMGGNRGHGTDFIMSILRTRDLCIIKPRMSGVSFPAATRGITTFRLGE